MTLSRANMIAAALVMASASATGAPRDALSMAVAFALSGSDTAEMRVLDQRHCVYLMFPSDPVSRTEYHLDNIYPERVEIRPLHNSLSEWAEVDLHGNDTVYEFKGVLSADPQQEKLDNISHPRHAADWTITIYTHEFDRLRRAWDYIYSHGCTGQRSAF